MAAQDGTATSVSGSSKNPFHQPVESVRVEERQWALCDPLKWTLYKARHERVLYQLVLAKQFGLMLPD